MSTQPNDGGPAFPVRGLRMEGCDGMSQRDYFAASALQGLLAGYVAASGDPESEARFAYKIADAMLRAREAKA